MGKIKKVPDEGDIFAISLGCQMTEYTPCHLKRMLLTGSVLRKWVCPEMDTFSVQASAKKALKEFAAAFHQFCMNEAAFKKMLKESFL